MHLPRVLAAAWVGLIQLAVACTLTDDDFHPVLLVSQAAAPDAGVSAGAGVEAAPTSLAPPPPAAPDQPCVAPFERSGCVTLLIPPASDCEGDRCSVAPSSCSDGALNGREVGIDCGGDCPSCPEGDACVSGADCRSGVCGSDRRCSAARCDDQVQNQDETAEDCGGSCETNCDPGQGCGDGEDCTSGVCGAAGCGMGLARCCQAPACDDGVQNGSEPVVDCGDERCGLCPLDRPCTESAECASGLCSAGVCRTPPCQDQTLNGTETDIDCGGADPSCARCTVGSLCVGDADCDGVPCVDGVCFGCANGVLDDSESDIDCGGVCGACTPGQLCRADADCQSGACQDGRCCGGVLADCTRCARRLASQTLSCEHSTDVVTVDNCNRFLDCLAQHPVECSVRHAEFCSVDPGGVCNHSAFGGNSGGGIVLADGIIGTAACFF
jgi:hypothetical protein